MGIHLSAHGGVMSSLPHPWSGSDSPPVYDYMSQNISILLVAATTFVFVLWCFRLMRSFLASTSFLVSIHNETAIQLEDYTDEEVGLGLIPSANDFTQLLRSLTAQRFPPLRIESLDMPCTIYKSSISLLSSHQEKEIADPQQDAEQISLHCTVDAREPIRVTSYWSVPKEDLIRVLSGSSDQTDDSDFNDVEQKPSKGSKGFRFVEMLTQPWRHREEKLLDPEEAEEMDVIKRPQSTAQQRHYRSNQSLLFPKAEQKNTVDVPGGMEQEITFPEKDWVDYSLLSESCRHQNANNNSRIPLVITISTPDHPDGGVLLLVVELREEETHFSITNQYQFLITHDRVHYLEDVYGQDDREECVVCLTDPKDTTILPCHHFAVCHECFGKVTTCPICRAKYLHSSDLFLIPFQRVRTIQPKQKSKSCSRELVFVRMALWSPLEGYLKIIAVDSREEGLDPERVDTR